MQPDITIYVEVLVQVYAFIHLKISYGIGKLQRFIFQGTPLYHVCRI